MKQEVTLKALLTTRLHICLSCVGGGCWIEETERILGPFPESQEVRSVCSPEQHPGSEGVHEDITNIAATQTLWLVQLIPATWGPCAAVPVPRDTGYRCGAPATCHAEFPPTL